MNKITNSKINSESKSILQYSGYTTSLDSKALIITSASPSHTASKMLNSFAKIRARQQASASTIAADLGIGMRYAKAPTT